MDAKKANLKPCQFCNGAGKVIAGYGVICTEIVEKWKKCPICGGKGFLGGDKGNSTLSKKLTKVKKQIRYP
jgi:DnaJ-class molecular chaperone